MSSSLNNNTVSPEKAENNTPWTASRSVKPIKIDRYFSDPDTHPFDQLEWDLRTATITDENGDIVFEQENVEVPAGISQLATKVVVSKYFYGELGSEEREKSFKELVHRVARTIADWAYRDGVLESQKQADVFYDELAWLCVNQYGAFNSPVWFNVGLYDVKGIKGNPHNFCWDKESDTVMPCHNTYQYPQSSACFIQKVEDCMEGIMSLATSEAMLFKHGSGTGTDLSTIRSAREKLSGGGKPSGPLSFMRVYDQIAAVVKSGGKTRRAAKMQSLKVHHPDIRDFITCKTTEEKKAWALIEEGYDGSYNGDAYSSIMFQNANLSVRVTDEFMKAVEAGEKFETYAVTTNKPVDKYDAREIMHLIAEGTHVCGDPGIQYDSTINNWHTCPKSGRINASNPCSEYMFLDDSACNLASLNLMKFRKPDGGFDVEAFQKAVRIFIIAQETLVDHGSYPTEQIARNSHAFRPLGLGYANLGSLIMSLGLPYDSNEARVMAGAITAIMTGTAYKVSAELAEHIGPFDGYETNRNDMLRVMKMHRDAVNDIDKVKRDDYLIDAARKAWDQAFELGKRHGYRNAQATVLAPTGTIGFMMDCDTTGIEPDIALVKYKLLAGGGMLKIVNNTVTLALKQLGYPDATIANIIAQIEKDDTIETAEDLNHEHLPVFDCAFQAAKGKRSIHHLAHVRMMATVQPFISGAISKTVNMPADSSIEDIENVYLTGWKLGLKAIAIYRDGSKRSQPLSTKKLESKKEKLAAQKAAAENPEVGPRRRRLPLTRRSITHKFDVAGHEGYLTVGLYEDGSPGELFITMAKEGSTVGGLMDAFGTCVSMALQYGVPLETLIDKFSHARFEPAGMTSNRDIPFAKSLIDYIARWLGMTFMPGYREANAPKRPGAQNKPETPLWPQPTANSESANSEKKKSDQTPSSTDKPDNTDKPAIKSDRLGHISNRLGAILDMVSQPAGIEPSNGENGDRAQLMQSFNSQFSHFQSDAPVCDVCGSITVRNGNCYRCFNCGASHGCS